jgi:hypothetical protein
MLSLDQSTGLSICIIPFFWQSLFVVFNVTLDYRIDFYIQGSTYNIFEIKTSQAVSNIGNS